jgi:hypothetical protein
MRCHELSADAFGDRFDLASLPLPRPARGYAVQRLGCDQLLDRGSGELLAIRSPALDGLFATFDEAWTAAAAWVSRHGDVKDEHHLAIVPAGYDETLQRHILIYGVLCAQP